MVPENYDDSEDVSTTKMSAARPPRWKTPERVSRWRLLSLLLSVGTGPPGRPGSGRRRAVAAVQREAPATRGPAPAKCRLVVDQAEHFLDQAGDQRKVKQREVVNPFDRERVLREVVA